MVLLFGVLFGAGLLIKRGSTERSCAQQLRELYQSLPHSLRGSGLLEHTQILWWTEENNIGVTLLPRAGSRWAASCTLTPRSGEYLTMESPAFNGPNKKSVQKYKVEACYELRQSTGVPEFANWLRALEAECCERIVQHWNRVKKLLEVALQGSEQAVDLLITEVPKADVTLVGWAPKLYRSKSWGLRLLGARSMGRNAVLYLLVQAQAAEPEVKSPPAFQGRMCQIFEELLQYDIEDLEDWAEDSLLRLPLVVHFLEKGEPERALRVAVQGVPLHQHPRTPHLVRSIARWLLQHQTEEVLVALLQDSDWDKELANVAGSIGQLPTLKLLQGRRRPSPVVHRAIRRIQERLQGDAGAMSFADPQGGELSIQTQTGGLTLSS